MRTVDNKAGLGLALVSAATFGTSGSFASSLLTAGWSAGAAVTVRVVIAAVALTIPALFALRRLARRAALEDRSGDERVERCRACS